MFETILGLREMDKIVAKKEMGRKVTLSCDIPPPPLVRRNLQNNQISRFAPGTFAGLDNLIYL